MKLQKLNADYIARHCGITACVFEEVGSTNAVLKEYAKQGAPAKTVVVAASQSAGRGRGDHSFFSPAPGGVYMSVLLRPQGVFAPADITAAAAVATVDALESLGASDLSIKWINDIYKGGKKVAGILAEAGKDCVVLGVGVNLTPPQQGFPPQLAERAGAVFEASDERFLRERTVIAFYRALERRLQSPAGVYADYRRRLFLLGHHVYFEGREATVTDLLPDFRLMLTFADGTARYLDSGEVSLNADPRHSV